MINKLVIENFKAIRHLEISLTPLTVLIGANSCGKSTVLQALDFVRAFATRDIDEYLNERSWTLEDMKSQFCEEAIAISISMSLSIKQELHELLWSFSIDSKSDKIITKEKIRNTSKDIVILSRGYDCESTPESIGNLFLKSSYLKLIDESYPSSDSHEELYAIKRYFSQSSSFELLAPDRMREKGSRGDVRDIGIGGERLAAYINKMTVAQKNRLNKVLTDFIGYSAKTSTETKRPGWVELFISEDFTDLSTKIKSTHISDGILRLIALISATLVESKDRNLSVFDYIYDNPNSGFILLDEIEDGINLYSIEKVIMLMREVIVQEKKQVIITTHSPAVADSLEPDEIIYMWRDIDGYVQAKPMFSTEQMNHTLRALSPGEVWINYDNVEILNRLSIAAGNK